ncbi:triphosphoribosyl-dephospho-CoA synthase [Azotobacter vinelandii CA]|uniref:Probable 2-(5''-triphosphoribosyl)-3'-dephosphocoenzyme-A synthase n=2 Tax=Azotobacter vinelandii TaxID=354 RepID=MDCB_AZOVD|nr:triphosphoribosyl-dephospho-CoA synthase [Azotobacter vinelandii]C1DNP5.1 RecName: Full=Probable 2-(5''-triphosphoribosyl)-3'-dephosphocoenzyme-A synthase; Short=2-(5''-triphosphoribosyl)-3'-dephospho-CoA synthase [Azotobacter vinelandii DJ]ACO77261.1 Triphosphoribosyl-dephospho-CoA synthase [Azotobacter vinelandii DJ]AGK12757.1 triphosphoribosyl-dephospho-CoA synthase [Azotobacter vinelandii CA]AGK17659.1 triphosphoribosyl-dephospho-CoA synthase [Azotobacter vinelandii CA6]SFX63192.1 triph
MSAFIATIPRPSLAERFADLAVGALIDEAELSPKPALVDRRGSGAHRDLDLKLMHASARALWPAFHAMAEAARSLAELDRPLRETIGRLGREGEARMLAVTGGVNTHRGAIWALGLLVTAAALEPQRLAPEQVSLRAARLARLEDRQMPAQPPSHGERVRQRYGVRGAREEARGGFPGVIRHGLPQLRRSRAAGCDENHARLDALLAIMAQLEDTCVLHRAGLEGLRCMQDGARAVLVAGGSASLAGRRSLRDLELGLLELNASPGGAADLLAVTLFLDRLEPMLGAPIGSL